MKLKLDLEIYLRFKTIEIDLKKNSHTHDNLLMMKNPFFELVEL